MSYEVNDAPVPKDSKEAKDLMMEYFDKMSFDNQVVFSRVVWVLGKNEQASKFRIVK